MKLMSLNGTEFKQIVINGAKNLKANFEEIDNLNVFPVPDGDTGTNMCHTMEGGIKAVESLEENNIFEFGKVLSKGMLMGARGNSGVILSQIFRGICRGFEGKESVNALELAEAFKNGVKQAYTAVVTPVEGTILTVFREATEEAASLMNEESSINDFFEAHLKKAVSSLQNTPNLLPVLKDAGVVDSGGAGYLYIVKGIVKYLDGEEVEGELSKIESNETHEVDFSAFSADDTLTYGYCTEFILRLQNAKVNVDEFDVNTIIEVLNGDDIKGDSIVALKDGDAIKVHVHTKEPGIVLQKMRKYGEFLTIKIENMALQHNENMSEEEKEAKKPLEHKKYAIVAVAQGKGIEDQFEAFGVDVVVSGNQTMNPSTEDFIKAFKKLDAENIFVFPNNKNIIMAAKQARDLYKAANVVVVETKSIPQCWSALTMLDFSSDDVNTIVEGFNDSIKNVSSGEITIAVRDTSICGVDIKKDDYMAILDGKIVASVPNKQQILIELLKKVPEIEYKEVLTLIFGEDLTDEDKQQALENVSKNFPYLEVGSIDGGQSVYRYLVAVE